jgi:hypothetical protein
MPLQYSLTKRTVETVLSRSLEIHSQPHHQSSLLIASFVIGDSRPDTREQFGDGLECPEQQLTVGCRLAFSFILP